MTPVSPSLFNLKQLDAQGPLSRFQSTRNEKDEIRKLVSAINNAATEERSRLKREVLEKSFKTYWPELEAELSGLARDYKPENAPRTTRAQSDVLEEILELARAQQRQVVSKDDLAEMLQRVETRLNFPGSLVSTQVFAKQPGSLLVDGSTPFSGSHSLAGGR